MNQTQIDMDALYDRLSALGFSKQFIREIALPDWWDEEFEEADTIGAAIEAAACISRRVNLDILSLLKPERTPSFKQSCQARFKLNPGTESSQLVLAQCMVARIAEMIAYSCTQVYRELPKLAREVRGEILKNHQYVNLQGLVEFCWDYGIPVVYCDEFPKTKGVRKFDGMAAYFYDRPVIVLSLDTQSPARLLFILAHELGHIVKGHLNGVSIVDEEIQLESEDTEEIEANEFALELLLGNPEMRYDTLEKLTGEKLADLARIVSARDRVDPGVIVLNYAWNKAKGATTKQQQTMVWETASKALNLLNFNADVPQKINQSLAKYLDLEELDVDSQEYLELVVMG